MRPPHRRRWRSSSSSRTDQGRGGTRARRRAPRARRRRASDGSERRSWPPSSRWPAPLAPRDLLAVPAPIGPVRRGIAEHAADGTRTLVPRAPRQRHRAPRASMGSNRCPNAHRMIDLTAPTERAFLIGLDDPGNGRWPVDRSLEELAALAETAGATGGRQRLPAPHRSRTRCGTSARAEPPSWSTRRRRPTSTS